VVIILPRYTEKASIRIVFLIVRKIRNKLKIYDFTGFERRPPAGNSSLGAKNLRMLTKQGVCNGDKQKSTLLSYCSLLTQAPYSYNMGDNALATPAELRFIQYHSSKESTYLNAIQHLISGDLSEPYSIYVYKYFLYQWGDLCYMVITLFSWIDSERP